MSRIYKVVDLTDDSKPHLVRANTAAQAVRYVVRSQFRAYVATQDDLVDGLTAGTKVEDATKEDET